MKTVSNEQLRQMCTARWWTLNSELAIGVSVSRELYELRSTIANLTEGVVFDNWDDDKLDELEERDPRVAEANRRAMISDLQAKASFVKEQLLSLRQAIPADVLAIIRDMLLEGKDVDAVAILASQLGMVFQPDRYRRGAVTIQSGNEYSFMAGPLQVLLLARGTESVILEDERTPETESLVITWRRRSNANEGPK